MSDYSSDPQVFVESLRDRNEGRIKGEWIDLSQYTDEEEVLIAIQEMLGRFNKDELTHTQSLPDYLQVRLPFLPREEWIVTDYEGFPKRFYSEHMGFAEVLQWVEDTRDMEEDRKEAYELFLDNGSGDTLEQFEEAYQGYYGQGGYVGGGRLSRWTNSSEEARQQFTEETFNSIYSIPKELEYYIDWEKMARDWFIRDYWESECHIFRNL